MHVWMLSTRLSQTSLKLTMLLILIFQLMIWKRSMLRLTVIMTMLCVTQCAVASLMKVCVLMVVRLQTSVLSGARLMHCQCLMEVQSSSVVRQCLFLHVLLVQSLMKRWLTTCLEKAICVSFFTITSLHSQQVRLKLSAA